jgi:hypothetical protein
VTSREYAEIVKNYADAGKRHSLNHGEAYRNLANFLWRPYSQKESQSTAILSQSPGRAQTFSASDSLPSQPQGNARFASLYRVSRTSVAKIPFTTVDEFCAFNDSEILPDPDSFTLLVLQGYPSPEWLNTLGAKYSIDPEFYLRHLMPSARPTLLKSRMAHTATHVLPSRCGGMVQLQTTRVGSYLMPPWPAKYADDKILEQRFKVTSNMHWYTESLATLQVGRMDFEVAESLIRDISILDDETFSLEQALSIAFQQVGNGWMGRFRTSILVSNKTAVNP